MTELKSCPFCGCDRISVQYLYFRPYVICEKCHAQIPCYNTYAKAKEAWNRRADEFPAADAPTVDAVVVTRCKDCIKFTQNGKYYNGRPFGYCYHWDYEEGSSPNEVDGDDFCSYGERKEGADNG